MIGDGIFSLEQLADLAHHKRSVICPDYAMFKLGRPKPAAFVMNLSGSMIYNFIRHGLYVYEKQEKSKS